MVKSLQCLLVVVFGKAVKDRKRFCWQGTVCVEPPGHKCFWCHWLKSPTRMWSCLLSKKEWAVMLMWAGRGHINTNKHMITFFIFQSQSSLGISQTHHRLKHGWIAEMTNSIVTCSLFQLSDFLEPENYYFGKPLTLMTMCSFLHKLVDWTFFSDVSLNVSSREGGCKCGLGTNKPIIKCSNYYYNTIIILFP